MKSFSNGNGPGASTSEVQSNPSSLTICGVPLGGEHQLREI
jgi:hypothetical protein